MHSHIQQCMHQGRSGVQYLAQGHNCASVNFASLFHHFMHIRWAGKTVKKRKEKKITYHQTTSWHHQVVMAALSRGCCP